jgi:hypothetical protein
MPEVSAALATVGSQLSATGHYLDGLPGQVHSVGIILDGIGKLLSGEAKAWKGSTDHSWSGGDTGALVGAVVGDVAGRALHPSRPFPTSARRRDV